MLVLIDTVKPAIITMGDSVEKLTEIGDKSCPETDFLIIDNEPENYLVFTLSQLTDMYYHMTSLREDFSTRAKAATSISRLVPSHIGENITTYCHKSIKKERDMTDAAEKKAPKKVSVPREGTTSYRIWQLAESMEDSPRKDVLAACEAEGINGATASTQYGRWLAFNKQDVEETEGEDE